MAMLMKTFDKYAGVEGNKSTLTKSELKTMMEKELPTFMKVQYSRQCFFISMAEVENRDPEKGLR